MTEKPPIEKYLAHSSLDLGKARHQGLDEHSNHVARLAGENAKHFGATQLASASGLLHDLGKYAIPFQQRLLGAAIRVNHSTWGAKIALEHYRDAGWLLAYGIAGHHAGLANGRGYEGQRSALAQRLQDATLPPLEDVWQQEIALPPLQSLVAEVQGFRFGDPGCKKAKSFRLGFLTRMLFSALVDADYLDTERYYDQFEDAANQRAHTRKREVPSLEILRDQLDAFLQRFDADTEVNRIRADILRHARQQAALAPGLFSLTVPTGGGKTLASLAFALDHAIRHGQRRVIFVIPFTSIVEQNAAVFRKALGTHGEAAVLEHHSAFTAPEPDKRDSERYQSLAKLRLAMENWDAPIIVTTAVQFFESLFAARPSQCRKLHNIANSVVVLDEAQTIPLHVLRPAVAAIDELARSYKASVVLCTATQPALQAPQFQDGLRDVCPLVEDEQQLAKRLERVRVRHLGTLDDETLAEHLRSREQVLCIVNNRLHARTVFQSMADLPGAIHLSTLMCAKHRSAVLAEARQRLDRENPQACRIVSTSLIEAGVDISVPTVMRAEAGLDSIAQAAGRCNRNKEWPVDASEVLVFANANDQWAPPPELRQFAQVAEEILRQPQYRDAPLSPAAIRAYFEKLYWQKGDKELDAEGILTQLQGSQLDSLPLEDVATKFRLINSTQQPIIIGWDEAARQHIERLRHAEKSGGLARKLQPYLVQVPRKAFAALRKAGAIQPIAPDKWGEQFMELVNMSIYSEQFGLWWEEPTFVESSKLVN